MQSKLTFICDRIIEAGWLAALVYTPIYFNVYSSRVFEPDKISMLRNIVLLMTVAWLLKLFEATLAPGPGGRRNGGAAVDAAAPSWLPALLRVPMMIPIIVYAAIYLFTTITSVVPLTAFFGSYQRLQGMISQYTYIMLGLLILANMRSRLQLERLVTFAIATSIPVATYGLLQATGHDPLPWAGDVQTRVASTLGNAIFLAAYLLMVVPLTLARWIGVLAARRRQALDEPPLPTEGPADPWPLLLIGGGAVAVLMLIQYAGYTTGNRVDFGGTVVGDNPLGDTLIWGFVLLAAGLWASLVIRLAAAAGRPLATRGFEEEDGGIPPFVSATLPVIQVLVLVLAIFILGNHQVQDFSQWIVLPAAIFIFYALTFLYTLGGPASRGAQTLQLVGLPLLMVVQILVIFLTQSRGPELGLLLGLLVFAYAFLLRRRLMRAFTVAVVLTVLFGGFLLVFNLPNSPIAAWRSLPYVGRLGLISQTDEGTGKVRTLIWGGAINLILSDPLRTVIGWGPESMYVAYNKFYPPDLGHWELRNATPDRSHDVFFDQAVTMGILGELGYLFLIGAFVWYAIRALRKAPRLVDQLLVIGLLAMVVGHVGELVTGIQIAATYTYFYMGVAALVVLAYVLNPYLVPAATAVAVSADEATPGPAPATAAGPANGHAEALAAVPAGAGAAAGAGRANGRAAGIPAASARKVAAPATAAGARRPANAAGPPPGPGRTIPPARGPGGVRANVRAVVAPGSYAAHQPLWLAAYVALGLVGLLLVLGLNVNLVKADMFYKQGLSYDNANRWPDAKGPYDKAITLSPNEDFYYLFLGRAYMEWAKNVQSFPNSPSPTELLQDAEHELLLARGINPLNTDHYANLGRLYSYWGDATGDQSRYTQAIQFYEQAHTLSPGNAGIWNELAYAYAKAGRFDDALAAIRGSAKMDSQFAQTPFFAGEIERADSEHLTALAQQPGVTSTISATYTLSATQLARQAGQDYGLAVKLDPTQLQDAQFEKRVSFLQGYGALPALAAGYQQAISQAIQARQQDPTSAAEPVEARSGLGYVDWKMGSTSAAIGQFERAVQLQCNDFYNLQNLGLLYRDAGQDEKALNTLQDALAVADCNSSDTYANTCAPLGTSTQNGSCSPLSQQQVLSSTLASLRDTVQTLKQKLGRP